MRVGPSNLWIITDNYLWDTIDTITGKVRSQTQYVRTRIHFRFDEWAKFHVSGSTSNIADCCQASKQRTVINRYRSRWKHRCSFPEMLSTGEFRVISISLYYGTQNAILFGEWTGRDGSRKTQTWPAIATVICADIKQQRIYHNWLLKN